MTVVNRNEKNQITKIHTKIVEEADMWTDIYYNDDNLISYKKHTYVINHIPYKEVEEWRYYHSNKELACIKNSEGFHQEFNINGLPIW